MLRVALLLLSHHPILLAEVHWEEGSGEIESLLSRYNRMSLHRPDLPPFPAYLARAAKSSSFP